jgi:hypothetical protein
MEQTLYLEQLYINQWKGVGCGSSRHNIMVSNVDACNCLVRAAL